MQTVFQDRAEAGRRLAERLEGYRGAEPVVIGVAPGGVPVAYEIARALDAPLDAWVVRQLHVGVETTTHVGAIADDDRHGFSLAPASAGSVAPERLKTLAESERPALARATEMLRHRPRVSLRNQTVLLVDDGLATGATIRAVVAAIRQEKPHRIVVAVPALVRDGLENVDRWVDDIVWLASCDAASDIATVYERFEEVETERVTRLLDRRRHELGPRWTCAAS